VRRNLIQIVHSFGFLSQRLHRSGRQVAGPSSRVARIRGHGDLLGLHAETAAETGLPAGRLRPGEREAIRENLLEQGYKPGNIVVIRNGITLAKAHGKEPGVLLRRELGIPLSARVVAVFSRLNRMKGVEYSWMRPRSGREVSGCAFPGGRRWRKQA